jgi:PKHD-type hydroxylase
VDAIIELGEAGLPQAATLTRGYEDQTTRKTTISWLKTDNPAITPYFLALANDALKVNQEKWRFDLWGFIDSLQYTVYHEGDEFGWHIDCGPKLPPRKLSVSVQLSDPADYDGGDLQLRVSDTVETAPRARGTVCIFPSFVSHRVTPVTRGVRKALVAWVAGPAFR